MTTIDPQVLEILSHSRSGATPGVAAPLDETDVPHELVEHARYRVIGMLGRGGMGAVYKAEHLLMGRLVALKVIRSDLLQEASSIERFRREIRAAARLVHPNIVTAFDAEQAGALRFLVMELVEGMSLAQIVSRMDRPASLASAANWVEQAAAGLQHAFERGMVHRDIKPQNMMLTRSGTLKVLDFGLARFVRESSRSRLETAVGKAPEDAVLTAYGAIMGTPDFLAPEQIIDAASADIRADIYSLGCTFYFLLTGRPPFPGLPLDEKLDCHLHAAPPPLRMARSDLPPSVEEVLDRMMAKRPIDRFQTPREVELALARLGSTDGLPDGLHPVFTEMMADPGKPIVADRFSRSFLTGPSPLWSFLYPLFGVLIFAPLVALGGATVGGALLTLPIIAGMTTAVRSLRAIWGRDRQAVLLSLLGILFNVLLFGLAALLVFWPEHAPP